MDGIKFDSTYAQGGVNISENFGYLLWMARHGIPVQCSAFLMSMRSFGGFNWKQEDRENGANYDKNVSSFTI